MMIGAGRMTSYSPRRSQPVFMNAFLSCCRITLGPYRKGPGVKRQSGAPQPSAGALSIRALEGSRWHQGCVDPHVMGFECWWTASKADRRGG